MPIESASLGQEPFAVLDAFKGKSKDEIKKRVFDAFGKDYALADVASLEELGLTAFPMNATGKIMKIDLVKVLEERGYFRT